MFCCCYFSRWVVKNVIDKKANYGNSKLTTELKPADLFIMGNENPD